MSSQFEHQSVISGIGQSAVGRRLGRSAIDLTTEAAVNAIEDAGLSRQDIDGITTYPGGDNLTSFGYAGPPPSQVIDALRLEPNWFQGSGELPGQLGAIVAAMMAVSAGLARHVLVYRTVTESTAQGGGGRASVYDPDGAAPPNVMGWPRVFGAPSASNWLAMLATRHFHEFGTTREQLGQIPVACRHHAGFNPVATYRDPLTLDDYLAARMISWPLCLFDCDVPVDGSTAIIVSARDTVPELRTAPVYIEAVGTAFRGRYTWDQQPDLTQMAATGAADHLWSRTSLRPADVDTAQLYDGFSILALIWLESLGFCKPGEGGPFVEGGARITLGGELPLNTSGGQLSEGRLHGYGLVHEAAVQLRGLGAARQVPNARVALVSNGGGPIAGAMLLTAEPPD
jgi:acetyl-CoA acetyltransferase